MKMNRTKIMREIIGRMQAGDLTPSEGYASIKAVATHMTDVEHEIDAACAEEALEIICRPGVE